MLEKIRRASIRSAPFFLVGYGEELTGVRDRRLAAVAAEQFGDHLEPLVRVEGLDSRVGPTVSNLLGGVNMYVSDRGDLR